MLQERSQNAEKTESKPTQRPIKRREFTDQQKAKIVAYAGVHGVTKTAKHYDIARSVIDRWKREKVGPTSPRYTDDFKAKVVAYARVHGATKAAEKFGPHNSAIYGWLKEDRKPAPLTKNVEKRVQGGVYLLARKLKDAVRKELVARGEINDVLLYASMLVKEILK